MKIYFQDILDTIPLIEYWLSNTLARASRFIDTQSERSRCLGNSQFHTPIIGKTHRKSYFMFYGCTNLPWKCHVQKQFIKDGIWHFSQFELQKVWTQITVHINEWVLHFVNTVYLFSLSDVCLENSGYNEDSIDTHRLLLFHISTPNWNDELALL